MNHLAHLYLSQSDPELLVGNYIADHVKGKAQFEFTEGIQKGIQMHRSIDEFTDNHPMVKKSKERLYPKYHKYAAVLVDMFYDHILAINWNSYSPIELKQFTNAAYLSLKGFYAKFPLNAQRMYDHMSTHDWLTNYARMDGMQKAFNGLAGRAKFDSKMEFAVEDLSKDLEEYKMEFEVFFPELVTHAESWTNAHE